MSVRKILVPREKLFILDQDEMVISAVSKMDELNIGVTLIKDKSDKIIGIFSERDLLRRVVAKCKNPLEVPLKDVMTSPLIDFPVGESPSAALELMQSKKIRHLPVSSQGPSAENPNNKEKEGEIIGLLSSKDLLAYTVKVISTYNKKLRMELDQYSFL